MLVSRTGFINRVVLLIITWILSYELHSETMMLDSSSLWRAGWWDAAAAPTARSLKAPLVPSMTCMS